MSSLKPTLFALFITAMSAQAQTKVLFGLDANWNKFHMFSLGFDIEQKLDINYGFCAGLKMSEYAITVNQVRQDPAFGEYLIDSDEKVVYLTIPLDVHYYFNPRIYAKGYTKHIASGGEAFLGLHTFQYFKM